MSSLIRSLNGLHSGNTSKVCPSTADNDFGPQVATCRRNLDFTLLFEQSILSLVPSVIFLLCALPRAFILDRRPATVRGGSFRRMKLVRGSFTFEKHAHVDLIVDAHSLHPTTTGCFNRVMYQVCSDHYTLDCCCYAFISGGMRTLFLILLRTWQIDSSLRPYRSLPSLLPSFRHHTGQDFVDILPRHTGCWVAHCFRRHKIHCPDFGSKRKEELSQQSRRTPWTRRNQRDIRAKPILVA